MLAAVEATTGQVPNIALADAGYRAEATFAQLAAHPADLYVAFGREGKDCAQLDTKANPYTAAMRAKMRTPQTRDACRRRKAIVEARNAWIKHVLGFRNFSMRGLYKAAAEWKLVCAALNLRRIGCLLAA